MTVDGPEPIRIAVVGTGFGGRVQIPGLVKVPGVEVIGVMSSGRVETARQVAQTYKIPAVCQDYAELLALPGLDAVSVVTPPYQHYEQTMQALKAGKHVLCEKPMALDLKQARQMQEAAQQAGLVGMIDHEFRYVPTRAYARDLIEQGWLGSLVSANITMLTGTSADPHKRPWGWLFDGEAGGGFLGALGSHYIDALRYWFGEISAVSATLDTFVKERYLPGSPQTRPVTVEDSFTLLCRFARGGQGLINVSVVSPFGSGERIELYGSQGALVIDGEGRLLGAQTGDEQLRPLAIPASYTGGPAAGDPKLRPFVTLAGDFVQAVRQVKAGYGLSSVSPSFADGVKVQQILDAARQSSETNCWVSLPPPK